MILKPCAEPRCRVRVEIGVERCPEHARARHAARNQDRKDRGLFSVEWRERRVRVLERDGYRCRLNFDGCTAVATQAHIDPKFRGDHNLVTDDDCVAACQSCNVYERNHRDGQPEVWTTDVVEAGRQELIFG